MAFGIRVIKKSSVYAEDFFYMTLFLIVEIRLFRFIELSIRIREIIIPYLSGKPS